MPFPVESIRGCTWELLKSQPHAFQPHLVLLLPELKSELKGHPIPWGTENPQIQKD